MREVRFRVIKRVRVSESSGERLKKKTKVERRRIGRKEKKKKKKKAGTTSF